MVGTPAGNFKQVRESIRQVPDRDKGAAGDHHADSYR
jgi:hypothetical protein